MDPSHSQNRAIPEPTVAGAEEVAAFFEGRYRPQSDPARSRKLKELFEFAQKHCPDEVSSSSDDQNSYLGMMVSLDDDVGIEDGILCLNRVSPHGAAPYFNLGPFGSSGHYSINANDGSFILQEAVFSPRSLDQLISDFEAALREDASEFKRTADLETSQLFSEVETRANSPQQEAIPFYEAQAELAAAIVRLFNSAEISREDSVILRQGLEELIIDRQMFVSFAEFMINSPHASDTDCDRGQQSPAQENYVAEALRQKNLDMLSLDDLRFILSRPTWLGTMRIEIESGNFLPWLKAQSDHKVRREGGDPDREEAEAVRRAYELFRRNNDRGSE